MKRPVIPTLLMTVLLLGACQNTRKDIVFEQFQQQMQPVQLSIDSLLKDSIGQVSTIYFSSVNSANLVGAFNLGSIRQRYQETNNDNELIQKTKLIVNEVRR